MFGRSSGLKLGPLVTPHAAKSSGLDSAGGMARSSTQFQYGIVTSGLCSCSWVSNLDRYSRCQAKKFLPSLFSMIWTSHDGPYFAITRVLKMRPANVLLVAKLVVETKTSWEVDRPGRRHKRK